ncbi:helix-turn-helix domain-containing protein [Peribacillus sp. YIM B13477]|uniref:helix-turn-helix domain-containing protein n=1 Tax=Peribacillus sp. YIM B13477 TaxID=3366300 RepID=UPI0036702616
MKQLNGKDVRNIRKYILIQSQDEFALAIGISQQMVSFIENGVKPVTKKVNEKIHEGVEKYIDRETLYKILDGEIQL